MSRHTRVATSIGKRRQLLRVLSSMLFVALGIWWFCYAPPPLVGGSEPDGPLAIWVKNRVYGAVSPLDEIGFTRLTRQNADGWYGLYAEPIQSFEYYQSQHPTRPTAQRRTIVLQPIGPMNAAQKVLLGDLKQYCQAFFQVPVRIEKPLPLKLAAVWRPASGPGLKLGVDHRQYDAANIIDHVLLPRLPHDALAYLGVTMADLWVGDMGYIFGIGNFDNRTGVYSLCRYYSHFGLPADQRLAKLQILRRACRVLNHETGHMLGLQHCVLYKCSMNGGNSLTDMDAAPLDYCPVCHRKLLWNIGCDGTKRYTDLLAFYRSHGMHEEAKWTLSRLIHWKQLH